MTPPTASIRALDIGACQGLFVFVVVTVLCWRFTYAPCDFRVGFRLAAFRSLVDFLNGDFMPPLVPEVEQVVERITLMNANLVDGGFVSLC